MTTSRETAAARVFHAVQAAPGRIAPTGFASGRQGTAAHARPPTVNDPSWRDGGDTVRCGAGTASAWPAISTLLVENLVPRAGLPFLAGLAVRQNGWRSEAFLYYKCDAVQIFGGSAADGSV